MPVHTRNTPFSASGPLQWKERWQERGRLHAVAAAVVLCASFAQMGTAHAMAMGRIMVQSALGEPLRAEIDLADITPAEAASLKVRLGSDEAFRAAGLALNPALTNLQISLQQRTDGRSYLRLTTARAVTEPFVDLIVEAQWASGRILRDYTLLLDPPKMGASTPVAPLPMPIQPATSPQEAPPLRTTTADKRPAPETPAAPTAKGPVKVQAGETASRIASLHRPASVSLDQMLVAMLRGNPQAFVNGNVNRIKAGAIVELPAETQAQAIAPQAASQLIAAQSRDFNEFRRRLAGDAQPVPSDTSERQSSGQIQTEVQDQRAPVATPDKLTLSKGSLTAQGADEEKIAQQRQATDASARVAELSRNLEDLAKIRATVPGETSMTTPQQAATPDAASVSAGDTPQAPASQSPGGSTSPMHSASMEKPAAVADASKDISLVDSLTESPLVLPATGGLLALLAGIGLFVARQRKKNTSLDSAFMESRLPTDSFFDPGNALQTGTSAAAPSGSSLAYSHSQLDTGDVDPVAEADVYLAYGRDLQAEEILKEALPNNPKRVAIYIKLLEIYAKRGDTQAFGIRAREVHDLTQGQGVEWAHVCDLGHEVDPSNPLYFHSSGAHSRRGDLPATVGMGLHARQVGANTAAPGAALGSKPPSQDLDLDLDLDLDRQYIAGTPATTTAQQRAEDGAAPYSLTASGSNADMTKPLKEDMEGPTSMSLDFDFELPPELAARVNASAGGASPSDLPSPKTQEQDELPGDFDFDGYASVPATQQGTGNPSVSFDWEALDLDIGTQADGKNSAITSSQKDAILDSKLSLAQELKAIGNLDGARTLAQEVMAEADGTLRSKATHFLANLS